MKSFIKSKYTKLTISILFGAGLGYVYYYIIGCRTGTCPITSTWYLSTLYGAFAGFLIGLTNNKKK